MIAPDLETLLIPLERFEALRRRMVFLGDRLCDLSYGNPYDGVAEATRNALKDTLETQRQLDLQYTPVGGHSTPRRAVADQLTASHGLPFSFGDIVLTPGATAALQVALRAAAAPQSEVIIPVPCWLDYPLYVRFQGLTPVLVPLSEPDLDLDVEAVASAVSPRTSAVLLSHPSNPTGRNYTQQRLAALGHALERAERHHGRAITLIADEVHRDFLPADTYRTAAAAWYRTLMIYSFGKYHFLQGQRLGYVAVSPRHPERAAIAAELVRWMRIAGFMAPTALMQRALPRLLTLRYDISNIIGWRERFRAALASAGFTTVPGGGTFFLYVSTPRGQDDFAFVEELIGRGVLTLPAPVFHHRGYFRLSLTGSERMLQRALTTLCNLSARCATSA